jgi:hypothetical protein
VKFPGLLDQPELIKHTPFRLNERVALMSSTEDLAQEDLGHWPAFRHYPRLEPSAMACGDVKF